MKKLSSSLQEKIDAAGPAPVQMLGLIVNLDKSADWDEALLQLSETGLEVTGQEEAIWVVYGRLAVKDIPKLAALEAVAFVESDEQAAAL